MDSARESQPSRDGAWPDDEGCSAWHPGVAANIPSAFRGLETIAREDCATVCVEELDRLQDLTGLPAEALAAFRPSRLALHEVIVRVTADIAVAEGEAEEDFGHNFRRIARRILEHDVAPRLPEIDAAHQALLQEAEERAGDILAGTLFADTQPPKPPRQGWFRRFFAPPPAQRATPPAESVAERDYRVVADYKAAGLAAADPLGQAVYKSLYRILGAILARRGRVAAEPALLARMVARHVGNTHGSALLGRHIAPWVEAAIGREGYARVVERAAPVLISLKGASAAGKSSLRPMLRTVMRELGMEPEGYATISPDVWRRLLLDYEALGPARKYAGHLTSRELLVIDGKLDRYIRAKANQRQALPHFLVDRFRFDSFSSEQVARVLHNTYAKHVETMVMYFVITPPEETVERGWRRALERGRYKAVEDFLGHGVEAYTGMPKIFFKWLAYKRPVFRYTFVDNRVPKGSFPRTVARGDQDRIVIFDPLPLVDIVRYQKVNIHAASAAALYPADADLSVAANAGFLREIARRIPCVELAAGASGTTYLRIVGRAAEVVDAALFARAMADAELAAAIESIAPDLAQAANGGRAEA